jgi:hypothetical protein
MSRKKNSRLMGGQIPLHFPLAVMFNKIKSDFHFVIAEFGIDREIHKIREMLLNGRFFGCNRTESI